MIKKLDPYQLRGMTDTYAVEKTIEKVNEIIDYLEAKEHPYGGIVSANTRDMGECGWEKRLKEAEEQDKIDSEKMIKAGLLQKGCIYPRNYARVRREMAEEQYYSAPPEQEDEWDMFSIWLRENAYSNKTDRKVDEIIDYLKYGFISKEKIKREGKLTISEMQKTIGWQPSYKAGYMDAIKDLLTSLGLGD